jgi:hypothetical protein
MGIRLKIRSKEIFIPMKCAPSENNDWQGVIWHLKNILNMPLVLLFNALNAIY